jgi:hypothetical protein
VPKRLRLVSIYDVLTSREARSDPTGAVEKIPVPKLKAMAA